MYFWTLWWHYVFQELAETVTRITHSHKQAIQGAILQCYAVDLALRTEEFDTDTFIDDLIDKMRPLEEESLSEQTDRKTDIGEEGTDGDKNSCDKEKWYEHLRISSQIDIVWYNFISD